MECLPAAAGLPVSRDPQVYNNDNGNRDAFTAKNPLQKARQCRLLAMLTF